MKMGIDKPCPLKEKSSYIKMYELFLLLITEESII